MVTMQVILVRHGHAGSKERWHGDDRMRPLSRKGEHQAQWLADTLVPLAPTRIVSSPYLRCLDTVTPLAGKMDLNVLRRSQLVPDAGARALAYVRRLGRGTDDERVVVCTHGEIIGVVLTALAAASDVRLPRKAPGQKGGFWVVGMRAGHLGSVAYTAPG